MVTTSKQMIKPSSPTPHHLRTLRLSFLDQLAPPVYTPLVLFYHPIAKILTESLKKSLSNVLNQFYPLAGRISTDNINTIDCNDSGALFVEAKVLANIADIIRESNMDELNQFLPLGPIVEETDLLLAVQMNVFDCGGIAVAVQISHKLADASSLVSFMNAWAAVCRGGDDNVNISPEFNLVEFFPPREFSIFPPSAGIFPVEQIVTKRFVFDEDDLKKLKLTSEFKDPSTVEAVSEFFLRHFMDSRKRSKKMFAAVHAVNLRPRMDPPLPNQTFGNAWRPATAVAADHGDIVVGLRDAIRSVDGGFVKYMQSGNEYLDSINNADSLKFMGELEMCKFSSWLRFPLYEVDYGWGRPVWVIPTTLPYKNLVILMGTSSGDGVEAWVNMGEEYAAKAFF